MLIGLLLSLTLAAPVTYFLTRYSLSYAQRTDHPYLGIVVLAFAVLFGLSALSALMVGIGMAFGFSGAVAAAALTHMLDLTHPGLIAGIGSLIVTIWGAIGLLTGPACAFVTAKLLAIINLIIVLCKLDHDKSLTYLPIIGAAIAFFCMWPFTACLTLGL